MVTNISLKLLKKYLINKLKFVAYEAPNVPI